MKPIIPSDPVPPGALLTEVEAAAILNIAPATLTAWRSKGRAARPAHCKLGGAIRYRHADIEAFIESSVQTDS